jgi:hypothetical protein
MPLEDTLSETGRREVTSGESRLQVETFTARKSLKNRHFRPAANLSSDRQTSESGAARAIDLQDRIAAQRIRLPDESVSSAPFPQVA